MAFGTAVGGPCLDVGVFLGVVVNLGTLWVDGTKTGVLLVTGVGSRGASSSKVGLFDAIVVVDGWMIGRGMIGVWSAETIGTGSTRQSFQFNESLNLGFHQVRD